MRFFLIRLLVIALLFQYGMAAQAWCTTVVDRIVAIVNQDIITLSELEQAVRNLQNPLLQPLRADLADPRRKIDHQMALKHLIEKRLQLQVARRHGITVDQWEIDQVLQEIRLQQGIPTEAALERLLSENDLTLSTYTRLLKEHLMILKLVNREVHHNILITEEELRNYYQHHLEDFKQPEKIRLAQILLKIPPDASGAQLEAIKARAGELRDRLIHGESFSDLAKRYSQAPQAMEGGDLGLFSPGELRPEIEQAVLSLKPGEISPVIETPTGIHLFKVLDRREAGFLPFEEVRGQIRQRIFLDRLDLAYQSWLKGLRDRAYIEIKL